MDPDQPASSVCNTTLVDMKMTCFHLLKVASDGNFYFVWRNLLAFSKLASAKFDP